MENGVLRRDGARHSSFEASGPTLGEHNHALSTRTHAFHEPEGLLHDGAVIPRRRLTPSPSPMDLALVYLRGDIKAAIFAKDVWMPSIPS